MIHSRKKRTFLTHSSIVLLLLFCDTALAATTDLHTVLRNLRSLVYPLMNLVLMFSFVAGIIMIFKAILGIKKVGQSMSYGAQPGEFGGPLAQFIVGAVLIYLPTSTGIAIDSFLGEGSSSPFQSGGVISLETLGTGASLLQYSESGNTLNAQFADLANTLIVYIQFIGFLAFVRGWFMISKVGSQGAQPGTVAKGITHIIGGILAINFVKVINLISASLYGG